MSVHTGHHTTAAADHYFVQLTAESSLPITRVSVSGHGGTTELQPLPDQAVFTSTDGDFTALTRPPVGTAYTFVIEFADGSQATYQESVRAWVAAGPVVTMAARANTAVISWTNVSAAVAYNGYYLVRVSGPGVYWESDDLSLGLTSTVFNDNGQAAGSLQSGQTYLAEVFVFNRYEDFAYQQVEFTMP